AFVKDPIGEAPRLVSGATTRVVYDLDRFRRCGQPPFAGTLAREMHVRDSYYTALAPNVSLRFQISFVYSDGFGRQAQTKARAEQGNAPKRAPDVDANGDVRPGALTLGPSGQPIEGV